MLFKNLTFKNRRFFLKKNILVFFIRLMEMNQYENKAKKNQIAYLHNRKMSWVEFDCFFFYNILTWHELDGFTNQVFFFWGLESLILVFLPHLVGWISKDLKDLTPYRTYDFHWIWLSTKISIYIHEIKYGILFIHFKLSVSFQLRLEILYFPYPYNWILMFPK